MSAGNNKRIVLRQAVARKQRHAGQAQQVQRVGVQLFIRQRDPQHVKVLHWVFAFQRVERQAFALHHGFHIHPWQKHALRKQVSVPV